jgi:hypothetical protein
MDRHPKEDAPLQAGSPPAAPKYCGPASPRSSPKRLLRAIRLVADTGFHSLHWNRQQVVDYFHQNSGIDEPNVQSETDRYMAAPPGSH